MLSGKGGFFDDLGGMFKSVAGPLLGLAGNAADSIFPGAGQVAQGIRRLTGMGAYAPVQRNAILAQPVPKVGSRQDKGIRYNHQEFLGDVTGSEDWELTQIHVNPGLPEAFPWLCGVAGNFQKYRIDGLVFYLRSTSSVAIASSTDLGLGTVLGGFQYNVYDKAPASKLEFLSLSGALSGKPSEDHIYPMECDPKKNVYDNLLVRTVGVSDDQQKYDHAVFNLATVGFPGEYYLGELWVSYDVTLMAPKVEQMSSYVLWNESRLEDPGYQMPTAVRATVGSDAALTYTLPCTDATETLNTMGWTTDRSASGVPCYSVPAGTMGHYLVNFYAQGEGDGPSNELGPILVQALDNSGTVTKDTTSSTGDRSPILNCSSMHGPNSTASTYTYTSTFSVHIQALPDKPLKFCVYSVLVQALADPVYKLLFNRLPDKLYANENTAAVSLGQKVARIRKRRAATAAAVASSRAMTPHVSSLEMKEPALDYIRVDEAHVASSRALGRVPSELAAKPVVAVSAKPVSRSPLG